MLYQPLITGDIPYRTFFGRDGHGGWHWHSEMELILCLRGSMRIELEDREFSLQAGDALILPGCCAHSSSRQSEDQLRVAIVFGYTLLRKQFGAVRDVCLFLPGSAALPRALSAPLEELKALFLRDGAVTEENEWRIRGNLFLLCHHLRTVPRNPDFSADRKNRAQRLENIYAVLDYVRKHYRQKISVEQMAELAGYAKTYFCRQFKSITGVPFYRYLTCYRISVACMLMEDDRYSMAHIAENTGFSSLPLFSRAFKEVTSMTPSQFQALPPEERNLAWINEKERLSV